MKMKRKTSPDGCKNFEVDGKPEERVRERERDPHTKKKLDVARSLWRRVVVLIPMFVNFFA